MTAQEVVSEPGDRDLDPFFSGPTSSSLPTAQGVHVRCQSSAATKSGFTASNLFSFLKNLSGTSVIWLLLYLKCKKSFWQVSSACKGISLTSK